MPGIVDSYAPGPKAPPRIRQTIEPVGAAQSKKGNPPSVSTSTLWLTTLTNLASALSIEAAELVVSGDRIFAVTKTEKSIYIRQIIPPKAAGRH